VLSVDPAKRADAKQHQEKTLPERLYHHHHNLMNIQSFSCL